jgi:hypothetical protein
MLLGSLTDWLPLRGRWLRYLLIGARVGLYLLFAPIIDGRGTFCTAYTISLWEYLHGNR